MSGLTRKIEKMRIDQKVGAVFGLVGVAVFLLRIIRNIVNDTLSTLTFLDPVYIGFGAFFLFLAFYPKASVKMPFGKWVLSLQMGRLFSLMQFCLMMALTIIAIIANDMGGPYNIPMMVIAVLMGMKYGVLGKGGTFFVILLFALLTELASYLQTGALLRSTFILLFMFFTFGIGFLLYSEDLNRQFTLLKKYRKRLVELEEQVESIKGKTIPLDSKKFTPREKEVLRYLCLEKLSNREISKRIGVKEQTVKTHLRRIFDKAGLDDRHELIENYKGNFIKK